MPTAEAVVSRFEDVRRSWLGWPRVPACAHSPDRRGARRARSRGRRRRLGDLLGRARLRRGDDRRHRSHARERRRSSCRSGSATTPRRGSSAAQSSSTRPGAQRRRERIFDRYDSLEAKLGAAFAAWPGTEDRSRAARRALPSQRARPAARRARAPLGRRPARRARAWREARDVEPDTPYAVWADDLIHPELAPGLPVFTPSFPIGPGRHAGGAARDAASRPQPAWPAVYGIALQRLGRPVSARRAFAEALRLAPNNVDALVADAVGRYEKSDPAGAFGRLGPLTRTVSRVGERALSPRRPPPLAGRREGGEAPAAARPRGGAWKPDRPARRSGTSRSSERPGPADAQDRSNGLWRPGGASGKVPQLCYEGIAVFTNRNYGERDRRGSRSERRGNH